MASSLRKVACVICGGIFKVEDDPPIEIVEPRFSLKDHPLDAYGASAVALTDDDAGRAYCLRTCPWCSVDDDEEEP